MRKNNAAEAIFSKYLEPKAPSINLLNNYRSSSKKKGNTLSDFYREVYAANNQNAQHPYQNKNATEIESIMMNNRRLIEAERSKRY